MKTAHATTTRTTAAHTALTHSAIQVELPRTPMTHATTWAACSAMVTAITKSLGAEIRTTETARAFSTAPAPKRPSLAQTSADITTPVSDSVSTIRPSVRTTTGTASATGTGILSSRRKLVRISEDITLKNRMNSHTIRTLTCAITTRLTAATGRTIDATGTFHRHITRARALPSAAITHRTSEAATIIHYLRADIRKQDNVTTGFIAIGQESSATRPMDTTVTVAVVTSRTITVRTLLTANVISTNPRRTTAVRADCLRGCRIPVIATTVPLTVRSRCFSPVTANATTISTG